MLDSVVVMAGDASRASLGRRLFMIAAAVATLAITVVAIVFVVRSPQATNAPPGVTSTPAVPKSQLQGALILEADRQEDSATAATLLTDAIDLDPYSVQANDALLRRARLYVRIADDARALADYQRLARTRMTDDVAREVNQEIARLRPK